MSRADLFPRLCFVWPSSLYYLLSLTKDYCFQSCGICWQESNVIHNHNTLQNVGRVPASINCHAATGFGLQIKN